MSSVLASLKYLCHDACQLVLGIVVRTQPSLLSTHCLVLACFDEAFSVSCFLRVRRSEGSQPLGLWFDVHDVHCMYKST